MPPMAHAEPATSEASPDPQATSSRTSLLKRLRTVLGADAGNAGAPASAAFEFATTGAAACPGCGAVLHDLTAESCRYCGTAFLETTESGWKRVWRMPDEGDTWTVVERTCPGCGGLVADAVATTCSRCGHGPLPPLEEENGPRPCAVLTIRFPPMPTQPGHATRRTTHIARYLDVPERHWLMPPPVPKGIVTALRAMPDACPGCQSTTFDVVLGEQESWKVVCANCGADPGKCADAV